MIRTRRVFAAAALLLLNLPSIGYGEYAFVWANNPTASSYTPDMGYQYNSTGAINTIARGGRGQYRVYMPNVYPRAGGNVQLTAYGSGSTFCNVGSWSTNVASPLEVSDDLVVHVYCFDASGNPADSRFTALYHDNGLGGQNLAYLWASEPSMLFYYTPAKYSYNSEYPESPSIAHFAPLGGEWVGRYFVNLRGWEAGRLAPGGYWDTSVGNLQVTTYSDERDRCGVSEHGYGYDGIGLRVTVGCYTSDGVPRNARFSLSYSRDRVLGFPETIGAYAYVVPRDGRALIGSAFNSAEPIDRARPTRWAPGRFRVDFPRLAPLYSKSTVLVTAEGGVNCKVAGWMKLTDDVAVFVDCYGLSGELQDSSFYVTLVTDARF